MSVFNASFYSAALTASLNRGGSSKRGHTPFLLIWKATQALKGAEVCECVFVYSETQAYENSAACEQKVFIALCVFISKLCRQKQLIRQEKLNFISVSPLRV